MFTTTRGHTRGILVRKQDGDIAFISEKAIGRAIRAGVKAGLAPIKKAVEDLAKAPAPVMTSRRRIRRKMTVCNVPAEGWR